MKKAMKTFANHANTVENAVKSIEITKKLLKIMENVPFTPATVLSGRAAQWARRSVFYFVWDIDPLLLATRSSERESEQPG